jgi:hypothetical protein
VIEQLQSARRRWGPCGLICDALGHRLDGEAECKRCGLDAHAIVSLNARNRHRRTKKAEPRA